MRFNLLVVLLSSLSLISASCAGSAVNEKNTPRTETVERQTYRAIGVIKAIDVDANRVTVDHEEIPGYMSAMEMNEMVSDHEVLGSIKVGDKVEFELLRTGSTVVYTQFTKIGEVAVLDGGELYKVNCAECHGAVGEGSKKGISLVRGHALHHSEEEHIRQVTDGEGSKMPAFRDKLSADQIKAVVRYVRSDIQKDQSRDPSSKHKH